MSLGRTWDWQIDIVIFIDYGTTQYEGTAGPVQYNLYTTKDESLGSQRYWDEDDISSVLDKMSDEELKVCMLHQPMLGEFIAKRLMK
jgi:hypothetical protein